jgi:hypothetical protein
MSLFKRSTQRVVDLRLPTAEPVAAAPPKPTFRFGRPSRCPHCTGKAFLDHIDIVDRIQYEHCVECGRQWTITEAELTEAT